VVRGEPQVSAVCCTAQKIPPKDLSVGIAESDMGYLGGVRLSVFTLVDEPD